MLKRKRENELGVLPREIICLIFEFCGMSELNAFARTCEEYYDLTVDPNIYTLTTLAYYSCVVMHKSSFAKLSPMQIFKYTAQIQDLAKLRMDTVLDGKLDDILNDHVAIFNQNPNVYLKSIELPHNIPFSHNLQLGRHSSVKKNKHRFTFELIFNTSSARHVLCYGFETKGTGWRLFGNTDLAVIIACDWVIEGKNPEEIIANICQNKITVEWAPVVLTLLLKIVSHGMFKEMPDDFWNSGRQMFLNNHGAGYDWLCGRLDSTITWEMLCNGKY